MIHLHVAFLVLKAQDVYALGEPPQQQVQDNASIRVPFKGNSFLK